MTVCHAPRRRAWGYKPLTIHDLLPMLGHQDRDWEEAELPVLVSVCGSCGGAGRCKQTFTAGCGGGSYSSKGECGRCKGVGLRYHDGGEVPLSVVNQILVARERVVEVVQETV